jgi:flagellin-like hook-associated protein FlgL
VESNLDIKTPKLNVQNVSSAILGKDGGSNGSIKNIHGTISKLAGHVRKAVIRIGALEKRVDSQEEKTTKIINILKTQKSNVGGKIPENFRDISHFRQKLIRKKKQLSLESSQRKN